MTQTNLSTKPPRSPRTMTARFDEEEMLRRASAALRRSGCTETPSGGGDVIWLRKAPYIVLANVRGVMGVFAVISTKNGHRLKGLTAWPKELIAQAAS